MLEALEHAHRAGVVHRDVKPGNILFETGTNLAKLADFGVACGIEDAARLTAQGTVVGTPWYMAPEQSEEGSRPDPRQDLFSVGVVLFEMLVGALPFTGPSPIQVLLKIRSEDPPDPCELNPAIPRSLADAVLRALQRDPSRRFQSAAEFAAALHEPYRGCKESPLPPTTENPMVSSPSQIPELFQKCSACGSNIIKSSTGLGGSCAVCQEPICARCWTIQGLRHCHLHLQPETVRDVSPTVPVDSPREDQTGGPSRPPLSQQTPRPGADMSPVVPRAESASWEYHQPVGPPKPEPKPDGNCPQEQPTPGTAAAHPERIFSIEKRPPEETDRSQPAGRKAVTTSTSDVLVETFLRRVANAL